MKIIRTFYHKNPAIVINQGKLQPGFGKRIQVDHSPFEVAIERKIPHGLGM